MWVSLSVLDCVDAAVSEDAKIVVKRSFQLHVYILCASIFGCYYTVLLIKVVVVYDIVHV